MLDDGLPALPHHHPCLAPAQRLGLVGLCLFPLMFRPSVLKPDFHLKLFIVITFYINLINNSDWLCVCVKEFEEMNQGMSYTSAQASQRSHSCSWWTYIIARAWLALVNNGRVSMMHSVPSRFLDRSHPGPS